MDKLIVARARATSPFETMVQYNYCEATKSSASLIEKLHIGSYLLEWPELDV